MTNHPPIEAPAALAPDDKVAVTQEDRALFEALRGWEPDGRDSEKLQLIAQARLAGERAGKWQPIETAPSSGVLLVCGTWDHEDEYYHGKPWWNIASGHENGPYGEWDEDQHPTHWQPLPAPPAIRKEAASINGELR